MTPTRQLLVSRYGASHMGRAYPLRVQSEGPGLFLVEGGQEPHYVGFQPAPSCDCGHHSWKDGMCKHIAAVLLALDDVQVATHAIGLLGG
jgi:hypothetical protein